MRRLVLGTAGVLLLALAAWLEADRPHESGPLLGPLAPIAAQVQWVRAHAARRAGDDARAFLLLESALAFEPRSTTAWIGLANQLGLQLASAESGRSPEERGEWLRAATAALVEGESEARDPAALSLQRGLLLMSHAETDPTIRWPGGTRGLWLEAAGAFAHAAELAGDESGPAAAARDYARAAAAR